MTMSPSLDKVGPTHHAEFGQGGRETEKCGAREALAQHSVAAYAEDTGPPRGGNMDCSDAQSLRTAGSRSADRGPRTPSILALRLDN